MHAFGIIATQTLGSFAGKPTHDFNLAEKAKSMTEFGGLVADGETNWHEANENSMIPLLIGAYPTGTIVVHEELAFALCGADASTKLRGKPVTLAANRFRDAFLEAHADGFVLAYAYHSITDAFAFCRWDKGRFTRRMSGAGDMGELFENLGALTPREQTLLAREKERNAGNDLAEDFLYLLVGPACLHAHLEEFIGADLSDTESEFVLMRALRMTRYRGMSVFERLKSKIFGN